MKYNPIIVLKERYQNTFSKVLSLKAKILEYKLSTINSKFITIISKYISP